ncbi:Fic family protein [Paraglaciecola sp. L3A3]|uniref:Fic family protein n=1 Tax=Paraglaciecola sp. L3A3 TaxID=2686358 RepID=UPI00131E36FF|nr:Fic family protein [Paraglaciecola sp. L3A3]
MYIWQYPNWTDFTYEDHLVKPLLQEVLTNHQRLLVKSTDLPKDLDVQAQMDALIQNAINTSEIEGEHLNLGSVRSSVARHLGLEQAGFTTGQISQPTEQTDSLVKLLTQVTANLDESLTIDQLCQWQSALFPQAPLLRKIKIGELRDDAPMQVVSQSRGQETVHFEAPPKADLEKQLTHFTAWFNTPQQPNKATDGAGIIRAAFAHLWFITLHPFEDGNGRTARALTDRALAQWENTSIRFYSLSSAIEQNRKRYYQILEATQRVKTNSQQANNQINDVTDWLVWFLTIFNQAIEQGLQRIERVVDKSRFWQQHSQTVLSERQVKVLNRLLDSQGEEFELGINARKYQSIAAVSKATATRDLADLVNKQCLKPLAGGGRSTRYVVKKQREAD